MKNMKKAVSFLLAFAMVFAMNFTTAFAAEAPENAATPAVATSSEDDGIMPLVWNEFTADVPANSSVTISGFSVPERYIAFEASATLMGGGTTSQTYYVGLETYGQPLASANYAANGVSHKIDWIDLQATNNSVGFKIVNHGNVAITVHIVYYSWS